MTDSRLGGFTPSELVQNAETDFSKSTGLPGSTASHDPGYNSDNVILEPLNCQGVTDKKL